MRLHRGVFPLSFGQSVSPFCTKAATRNAAWGPRDSIRPMSHCIDIWQVLRHPTATFGCAWHPRRKWKLATTSEAGPVYIWDLNVAGDSCLQQALTGHDKKSFSVAWSPLLDDLLLSAGDDATARVWDVKSGTCVALLVGHQTEVRALCWHPEIPWLVFTGRYQYMRMSTSWCRICSALQRQCRSSASVIAYACFCQWRWPESEHRLQYRQFNALL